MIEIDVSNPAFEALRETVESLNAELAKELRAANRRMGAILSGQCRKVILTEVYDVPIPVLASALKTFDLNTVPKQLRPFVVQAGQHGPGTVRIRFRKALSDEFLAKHFQTSRQTVQRTVNGERRNLVFRKWRRAGDLLNSEGFRLDEGQEVFSLVLVNSSDHAAARNALGGPNPPNRKGRKAGVQRDQSKLPAMARSQTRPIQWQEKVVKENLTLIKAEYNGAIAAVLQKYRST